MEEADFATRLPPDHRRGPVASVLRV